VKIIFTFFLLLIVSFSSSAQIPNPGFENWSNGNPDEWYSNNIPTLWTTITQTMVAHSGNSAVRGTVVTPGVLPLLMSGITGEGFLIPSSPTSLRGFYQFHPLGNDKFIVTAGIYQSNNLIGIATFEITTAATSYTEFVAVFEYASQVQGDKCIISVIAGPVSGDPNIGAYFLLDDLQLSFDPVGVNDNNTPVLNYKLAQNYPNPFNPATRITYEIPSEDFITIKVFDILGNEVSTLVNEYKKAGSYNVDFNSAGLSNGVYFYKLITDTQTLTRKMILLK
jgi:hypothetical protein